MEFTVLSHAGLAVSGADTTLLCDPWLVGSCYWRSWWNYPPVAEELVEAQRPDAISLSHIHWDHFHGVTLRRFDPSTPILVPRGHHDRMRRDLEWLGFTDVRELRHGRRVELGDGFAVTSYQFGPFLDSALVIETEGVTLFNVTDAKLMGRPLQQVLDRHPDIDVVFRSHSSANGRLCFEIMDDPTEGVDDEARYVRSFVDFVVRTGATHAIPFASNHCFLHPEVFDLNHTIKTPQMVLDEMAARGIERPTARVMVSGDTWSSTDGFSVADADWFTNRDAHLEQYRLDVADRLAATEAEEAAAVVDAGDLAAYFSRLSTALPAPLRRFFRTRPIAYVLAAGDRRDVFLVDLSTGSVRELATVDDAEHPAQVHVSAHVLRQCMERDLFSHLPISKRVRYRVTKADKRTIQVLNLVFNLYEYDYLPLRRNVNRRFVRNWADRWRELLLYGRAATDLALGRGIDVERY